MPRAGAVIFVLASLLPLRALACSGTAEVYEAMQNSNRLGWVLLLIGLLLGAVAAERAFRRRKYPIAVAAILICALHPGIWYSAYVGDCGFARVRLALWATEA